MIFGLVSFILYPYNVKVDFSPNLIRKYTRSLKISIYKDKGCYCSPHIGVNETKNHKSSKERYVWCICGKYMTVGDKIEVPHNQKNCIFLPKIMEHYKFDFHHRCICILQQGISRANSHWTEVVHLAFLLIWICGVSNRNWKHIHSFKKYGWYVFAIYYKDWNMSNLDQKTEASFKVSD